MDALSRGAPSSRHILGSPLEGNPDSPGERGMGTGDKLPMWLRAGTLATWDSLNARTVSYKSSSTPGLERLPAVLRLVHEFPCNTTLEYSAALATEIPPLRRKSPLARVLDSVFISRSDGQQRNFIIS
jgi:hypothetical protein